MSNPIAPPIVKCARALLREVERSVVRFPRQFKYSLGQDLRNGALQAVLLSQDAFRLAKRPECIDKVRQLSDQVDALNVRLQVSYELRAWTSAGAFKVVAETSHSLGRQCGAWHRSLKHPQGQNPAASAPRERAGSLSIAAAREANP
jgi:hypothetical protein